MTVPQGRNKKKTKRRGGAGHTVRQRRYLLDRNPLEERKPDFEDWLSETRQPGDWLENKYLEEPTLEDRLFFLHQHQFLDRPRSFLDNDNDYNPDIGNDFDDLGNFEE